MDQAHNSAMQEIFRYQTHLKLQFLKTPPIPSICNNYYLSIIFQVLCSILDILVILMNKMDKDPQPDGTYILVIITVALKDCFFSSM